VYPQRERRVCWRMEELLELYAEPYDSPYPLVCFDASPDQLVSEVCQPLPVSPGATMTNIAARGRATC